MGRQLRPVAEGFVYRAMKRACVIGLIALAPVLVLSVWAAWERLSPRSPPRESHAEVPADPRLTYATPFRNVRPDVQYVGDGACAGCHAGKSASYRRHPMGRSFAPITEAGTETPLTRDANNPFEALGFQFQIERRGERIVHRMRKH